MPAPVSPAATHTAAERTPRSTLRRRPAAVAALAFATSVVAGLLLAGPAAAADAPAPVAAPAAAPAGVVSLRPVKPSAAHPTYFTLTAAPGRTLQDAVVISNGGDAPVSLAITPVDGITGQTSGSVYGNRQDPTREAGRWVKPEISSLTLAARSSQTVRFTVTVPAGTTAGDHLAGIAVENTQPREASNGFPVKEIFRSVVGVLVDVPGGTAFAPKVSNVSINGIGATGVGAVDVTLANAGQRLGKPTLTVALNGPDGYSKTQTRELDTVLAGDTITYPLAWPDRLPPGEYTVAALLTGGGRSASLTKDVSLGTTLSGVSQRAAPAPAAAGTPWWQWAAIAGGAAVLFALVLGFFLRRSRGLPPGGGRGPRRAVPGPNRQPASAFPAPMKEPIHRPGSFAHTGRPE